MVATGKLARPQVAGLIGVVVGGIVFL